MKSQNSKPLILLFTSFFLLSICLPPGALFAADETDGAAQAMPENETSASPDDQAENNSNADAGEASGENASGPSSPHEPSAWEQAVELARILAVTLSLHRRENSGEADQTPQPAVPAEAPAVSENEAPAETASPGAQNENDETAEGDTEPADNGSESGSDSSAAAETRAPRKGSLFGAIFPTRGTATSGAPNTPGNPLPQKIKDTEKQTQLDAWRAKLSASDYKQMAADTLQALVRSYENRDRSGFMNLVSSAFLSADGKSRNDLENSIRTDFRELFSTRFNVTGIDSAIVSGEDESTITLNIRWNRTADVEISGTRQRWTFSGRSGLTFRLEAAGHNAVMRFARLNGDKIFGLTNLQGVLLVTAPEFSGVSRLNGQPVTTPVAVGQTGTNDPGIGGATLENRSASFESDALSRQSFDFSDGSFDGVTFPAVPTQGDIYIDHFGGNFVAISTANITDLGSLSTQAFNDYDKDRTPASTSVTITAGHAYLVRTVEGNFAKFRVTSVVGPGTLVNMIYAYQPDGSGNLASA